MSLQVGAPTLHSKPLVNQTTSWRKLTHRIGLIEVAAKESDLTSTPATINFAQGATVARRAIPCLEIAQRPHCSSKSRTDSVSSRCRTSSLESPMRLGRAKHLPMDSPSGCGCPSRAGMPSAVSHNSHKGHRPIVTAHRDGFSHDRRSLSLDAIGHVWEANALACNAIEETCSRTALFREKTCLSSDRKAQFSLNRMLDGASERICPCFTRS